MPILDKYIPKQTQERPYKAGYTAIFIAGVLLLITGQANETSSVQNNAPAPIVEKWVTDMSQPKRMTLTHQDGRSLNVFLVQRNDTHITMQRTNDGRIFQFPITSLCEKDQTTINTYWDPKTRFPYYKMTVVRRSGCGMRRSCR